jgi:hypothetical protein
VISDWRLVEFELKTTSVVRIFGGPPSRLRVPYQSVRGRSPSASFQPHGRSFHGAPQPYDGPSRRCHDAQLLCYARQPDEVIKKPCTGQRCRFCTGRRDRRYGSSRCRPQMLSIQIARRVHDHTGEGVSAIQAAGERVQHRLTAARIEPECHPGVVLAAYVGGGFRCEKW